MVGREISTQARVEVCIRVLAVDCTPAPEEEHIPVPEVVCTQARVVECTQDQVVGCTQDPVVDFIPDQEEGCIPVQEVDSTPGRVEVYTRVQAGAAIAGRAPNLTGAINLPEMLCWST